MTTIYLIRHGQASFGAESYDKLSPNGELQATLLGQYFNQILKEAPYVVAGSMPVSYTHLTLPTNREV